MALDDGRIMTDELYREIRNAELERLRGDGEENGQLDRAAGLLDSLVLTSEFTPFLTLPGYRYLS